LNRQRVADWSGDSRFTAWMQVLTQSAAAEADTVQLIAQLEAFKANLAAETARCERLRMDLELRNAALDAAPSHFVITDFAEPRARIVYVNRSMARDYGYEPSELLGRDPREFLAYELNETQVQRMSEELLSGRSTRAELRSRRKDGSLFWVGLTATLIRGPGGHPTYTVSVGADITVKLEQERAQKLLQDQLYNEMQERVRLGLELRLAQKLESVGRLAAGIAHEINTPIQYVGDSVIFLQSATADLRTLLSSYRATIATTQQQLPNPQVLAALTAAEDAADLSFVDAEIPRAFERTLEGIGRVAAIVRAMKEFAHPDATEHRPADLNHALETTLVVSHAEYKYHAIIERHLEDFPQVTCNVGELNQVFLNLIVNAAHAIRESGKDVANGRIVITTALDGDHAVISIADNGCGIPQDHLDKIFDPFFTTKAVGVGTGQGLAIARSIVVEKHGGTIDVHSTLGAGTCFTLRLPIAGRTADAVA
jgi:PAS domain S-box-containing protein